MGNSLQMKRVWLKWMLLANEASVFMKHVFLWRQRDSGGKYVSFQEFERSETEDASGLFRIMNCPWSTARWVFFIPVSPVHLQQKYSKWLRSAE